MQHFFDDSKEKQSEESHYWYVHISINADLVLQHATSITALEFPFKYL